MGTEAASPRDRLPLRGITVVAVEQAVAVPLATRHLADLGARVIKVERAEGDFARGYDRSVHGTSAYFAWLNRGKESITLDLKDPADLRLLRAMVAGADVFVQNLAPGATDRLGLGAAALRQLHPNLITCAVTGYGDGGPERDRKAYDLLVQCEAGLLSTTGSPEQPARAGISVADIAAGMYAYTGILTALYQRERTGTGSHCAVAMLDALGEWMSQPYLATHYGGTEPPRSGAHHATIAPYGPHRTGDGRTLFLGVQSDREWRALCEQLLHRPELATDPRFATNPQRVAHRAELTAVIEEALVGYALPRARQLLDRIGIANAQLRTVAEFAEHPQLAARDRWRQVPSPGGAVRSLLPPVTVPGQEAAMGPIPALGQHNAALRAEFGAAAAALENRDK